MYSLALSVKMNVLLFAPGLALLLVRNTGLGGALTSAAVVLGIQAALGAPFLLTHPESYLARAFELSRVFFHKWTVNWKFVPEPIFVGKPMALALLAGHLLTLLALAHWRWTAQDGGLVAVCARCGLLPAWLAKPLLGKAGWDQLMTSVARDANAAAAAAARAHVPPAHLPPLSLPSKTNVTSEDVSEGGSPSGSSTDDTTDVEGRATPMPTAAVDVSSGSDASPASGLRRRSARLRKADPVSLQTTPAANDRPSSSSSSSSSEEGAASPVRRPLSPASAAGALPLLFVDSPGYIAYVLLVSNFVGIVFSRTLHYQFYSWYFHALPAIACGWAASSRLPLAVRLAALAGIEWAFNVGDKDGAGSPASSAALQVGHWTLLLALALAKVPPTGHGATANGARAR